MPNRNLLCSDRGSRLEALRFSMKMKQLLYRFIRIHGSSGSEWRNFFRLAVLDWVRMFYVCMCVPMALSCLFFGSGIGVRLVFSKIQSKKGCKVSIV